MERNKVRIEKRDGIAEIVMECGSNLNAIDLQMAQELLEALQVCEDDQEVKVIVLRSAIKAFSAGGDLGYIYDVLKEGGEIDFHDLITCVGKLAVKMKSMSKLIITSIDGPAAGAGAVIAIAGDVVILSEKAQLIQAFTGVGLVPDTGGAYFLPRLVGSARAMRLFLTGEPVSAQQAFDWGIATEICSREELEAVTRKWAVKLSRGPLAAYANLKKQMYVSVYKDLEAFLEKGEGPAQTAASLTDDFKEGVTAFIEKRKPVFKGK